MPLSTLEYDPIPPPQPRRLLLPHTLFQLPLPFLVYYLPVSSFPQHILRVTLLLYTLLIAVPITLILAPFSAIVHILALSLDPNTPSRTTSIPISLSRGSAPSRSGPLRSAFLFLLRVTPVLPIHPHNLPPYRSIANSLVRSFTVYSIGTLIWSWTGTGVAPDYGIAVSRWITATVRVLGRLVTGTELQVKEELMPPLEPAVTRGVLKLASANPVIGFWLTNPAPPSSPSWRPRRAFLFLAGGGYVTGFPLVHPFVFSLLPRLRDATVLAPDVRKALSMDRSFPAPLVDALAGYAHLRKAGFEPEDITIMGDSAGGGMAWSVVSYLAAIRDSHLGIPGGLILISPWLSLPPTPASRYPDVLDEPMLLNAARCYLGRFPLLKNRPNPFASDLVPAMSAFSRRAGRLAAEHAGSGGIHLGLDERDPLHRAEEIEDELLQPDDEALHAADEGANGVKKSVPSDALKYLTTASFEQLSSHHPFFSPSTDLAHPFVHATLTALAEPRQPRQSRNEPNGALSPTTASPPPSASESGTRATTRILIHSGSAEWFHAPAEAFGRAALELGVDVTIERELGGVHAESCVVPAEFGGAGAGLIGAITKWMGDGDGDANGEGSSWT